MTPGSNPDLSERSRRLALSLLISRIRWLVVPLALADTLLGTSWSGNQALTLVGVGLLVASNLAITFIRRYPGRVADGAMLMAVAADFVVVFLYTLAFGRNPADFSYSLYALVGAEAAGLYRRRGVAWVIPLSVATIAGVELYAIKFVPSDLLITIATRSFQVVAVTVVIAALTDQSERRREAAERAREEALQAREKLSTANRELVRASELKTSFLSSVSHELRTPLSVIIAHSELLQDPGDVSLSESQLEGVTQIHRAGLALLELINDLLDLSKIEAGSMDVDLETVDLGEIVEEVTKAMRPLAQAKGLELAAKVGSDGTGIQVRADWLRLRQVLLNLVSNAIKFTLAGSVTIACLQVDQKATVSVTDTGIGIPEAALDLIFGEFVQGGGGVSRRFGGTGLGLAISRRLVEMQGGWIGVESQVDHGSRFWFTIPMAELALDKSPQEALPVADGLPLAPLTEVP